MGGVLSDFRHRILVTGGKGFVGSHLKVAMASGVYGECELIGLDRDGGDGVDIRDMDAVAGVVRNVRPTAVIHLAAVAAPAEADRSRRQAWDINVVGTFNLADAVMRHAPEARFIQVGSSESYGASFLGSLDPLDESANLEPTTVYAATKTAADIMIGQMARDGLRAVRFRPFNHTGPGQKSSYVVPAFASQVAKIVVEGAEPSIQVGNLDVRRDFTDVRDIVRAYALAATTDLRMGRNIEQVFNLASGRPRSIREVLQQLIALSGHTIGIVVDPNRVRPNETPFAAGNASRAASVLGWRPELPFETTLVDVLEEQLKLRRADYLVGGG